MTFNNKYICPWCNSHTMQKKSLTLLLKLKRWICKSCGAMGYTETPHINNLQKIYDSAWLDAENHGKFATGSTSKNISNQIVNISPISKTDLCLDYGGGKGDFAKFLVSLGLYPVHVIEPFGPNPNISGVTWHHDWSDICNDLRFSKIFLIEVIEHLLNPELVLRTARNRLKENGWIIITTPNAHGWRARIQKTKWREAQNPTHINLFSFKALSICLKRAGYTEIHRINRPMKYNKSGFKALLLGGTQLLGIDGSLRIMAR